MSREIFQGPGYPQGDCSTHTHTHTHTHARALFWGPTGTANKAATPTPQRPVDPTGSSSLLIETHDQNQHPGAMSIKDYRYLHDDNT